MNSGKSMIEGRCSDASTFADGTYRWCDECKGYYHKHDCSHRPGALAKMIVKGAPSKRKPIDPLQRKLRDARASTDVGKLEKLLDRERYWRMRSTIADNKLAEVQKELRAFAVELAKKTSPGLSPAESEVPL